MKKMSLFAIVFLMLFTCGFAFGFSGGDGTAGNPYQISTKADLDAVNNNATYVDGDYAFVETGGTCIITHYTGAGGDISIPAALYIPPPDEDHSGRSVTVTSIGNWAFERCSSVTSVTIGNSVTTIGSGVFSCCSSLTNITIGNSVTTIGDETFFECSSLTNITIGNSVTTIGSSAFSNCSSLASIVIPDSVTSIGDDTFYECSSLTNITIGNSVTSIGSSAFAGCSLASIVIPDSVTTIGGYTFSGCSSLTSLLIGNNVTSIGSGTFSDCSSLVSIVIPDSVTSIGDRTFERCSSLTSVTIGNSVTSIGDYTFKECSSLASIVIPDSVTSIGYCAFIYCSSLASIVIPDSVTSIGGATFNNCSNLTSATIGNSVTSIGSGAFYNCSSLTSVYFKGDAPTLGYNVFYGVDASTVVYYIPSKAGWGPTYEGFPTGIIVTTPLDVVADNDDVSLREAVDEINTYPAGYTGRIKIDPALADAVFYLNSPLAINYDLNLQKADDSVPIILDGNYSSRIFEIASGVTVNCFNVAFEHGSASGSAGLLPFGGAIYNQGLLYLTDCDFASNTALSATGSAGAIYSTDTLSLTNCTFSNNQCSLSGGAISSTGMLEITGCEFTNNSANLNGGAIKSSGGDLTIADSVISGNFASDAGGNCHGGGINASGTTTITGCTISNNHAEGGSCRGGGLALNGTWDMSDCDIFGNIASLDGGGLMHFSGTGTMTNCNVYDNEAYANGGGIYNDGTITLTNTQVYENDASGQSFASGNESFGGGIYSSTAASSTFDTALVYDNTAETYGQNYWPIPRIRVSDGVSDEIHNYDMGVCGVDSTVHATFTIYDWSVVNLVVTEAPGLTAPFVISPTNVAGSSDDWTVVPDSSGQEITVSFSPTSTGAFSQTLTLLSNDIDTPNYEIVITGRTSENIIPSLGNLSFDQAMEQIVNSGYVMGNTIISYDIDAGSPVVTGQSPVAGTIISQGSSIDLQVRKSPESAQDGRVDLVDFAQLAAHWLENNCSDSDWCNGADVDLSGDVGVSDLQIIAEYWLNTAN